MGELRIRCDANPESIDQHLPAIPWDQRYPAHFVWHHINRRLVPEAKSYRLKKGHGRDLCHAVVGAAFGSFAALDKEWKRRVEALPSPNGLAKVYYAPELELMVGDLEEHASAVDAARPPLSRFDLLNVVLSACPIGGFNCEHSEG